MKPLSFLICFVFFLFLSSVSAQIETRLATSCATEQIEIPIVIKNLEDIKSFDLKLLFDSTKLNLDTSLYHNPDFSLANSNDYQIKVEASNDTISIHWAAGFGVNVEDDLLLSLVFTEIASGNVEFAWIEEECSFTNSTNLDIDATYIVDSDLVIPYQSTVSISFEQFTIGCRDNSENGGCKAQVEVSINGGSQPYTYQWYDRFNQNDSRAIGLCEDPVAVKISDAAGCVYAGLFDPIIFPAINKEDEAGFEINYSPEEIFITQPYVDFSVETGDTYIEKYLWEFGDNTQAFTESEAHVYPDKVSVYPVTLTTENIDGCDTTISVNVEIKELNFCIPNVFTPNGDGINDTWVYKLIGADAEVDPSDDMLKRTGLEEVKKCSGEDLIFIDHFKSTHLVILNRGGRKVFECNNCTEYWDGSGLPDGVYFYVFTWVGEYSNGKEQGDVTILGSQN